jgi:nicotinamidase-related amidase
MYDYMQDFSEEMPNSFTVVGVNSQYCVRATALGLSAHAKIAVLKKCCNTHYPPTAFKWVEDRMDSSLKVVGNVPNDYAYPIGE